VNNTMMIILVVLWLAIVILDVLIRRQNKIIEQHNNEMEKRWRHISVQTARVVRLNKRLWKEYLHKLNELKERPHEGR